MHSHHLWLHIIIATLLSLAGSFVAAANPPAPPDMFPIEGAEQLRSAGGACYGLTVQGTIAYLGEGTTVTILDVSEPASPRKLASLTFPALVWDMETDGSLLFVANGNTGGVQIVDVSTPATPRILGSYDTPGVALRVDALDNRVYVADSIAGLHILDVSNPSDPTLLGSYTDGDMVNGVQVVGSIAYVADDTLGLLVLDVSTPTNPVLLGRHELPQYSYNLHVEENLVYMLSYLPDPPYDEKKPPSDNDELHIIDVSNPSAPQRVGLYKGLFAAENLAVEQGMVAIADGSRGLKIVDARDPSAPFLVGTYPVSGWAEDVALHDQRVFIASDEEGLLIVNIGEPTIPTLLGRYDVIGWVYDIAVQEEHTYIAAGENGLHILDQQDNLLGTFRFASETPPIVEDIAVSGSLAYVGTNVIDIENLSEVTSILHIYDISTPSEPVLLGHYDMQHRIVNMDVVGTTVYLAMGDDGLYILDARDPAHPVLAYTDPRATFDVQVDQTIAYVVGDGLAVLDVSDPTSPIVIGETQDISGTTLVVHQGIAYISLANFLFFVHVNPNDANFLAFLDMTYQAEELVISDVLVLDGLVYIASGSLSSSANAENGRLDIVDVSDGSHLTVRASLVQDTWGIRTTFASAGDILYVATAQNRLDVFDLREPTNPERISTYEPSISANYSPVLDVTLAGNQAFLATGPKGFDILDVQDPSAPVYAGGENNTVKGIANAIEVHNDVAYLTGDALNILDVHDPTSPRLLASYPSIVNRVLMHDTLLYAAEYEDGLRILNVRTPAHPQIIGHYDTAGHALDVQVVGNIALVADGWAGLTLLDVQDPSHIEFLGSYDTPGYAYRVQVRGSMAYVIDAGDDDTGLRVIDISNPTVPRLLGNYNTPNEAMEVVLDGDVAYVSTVSDGIYVLDISNPATPILLDNIVMPGVSGTIQNMGNTLYAANWNAGYQTYHTGAGAQSPEDSIPVYIPLVRY